MQVAGIAVDLLDIDIDIDIWWLIIQLIVTLIVIALALLHFLKNTASNYMDANFNQSNPNPNPNSISMSGPPNNNIMDINIKSEDDAAAAICSVCSSPGSKKCSACKSVRYCSSACQIKHWNSGHKTECKDLARRRRRRLLNNNNNNNNNNNSASFNPRIALVPSSSSTPISNLSNKHPSNSKVLFPYDQFLKLFNWENPGFHPIGLLNCGNSCFANVVLQCLTHTRPLVAYLLEKGHRTECRRNDWCFLCEFQTHVERASRSQHPFSPISILSRLPNIGGNLGCGSQEDAHEFMRFAIDTMQSVCLDEFGGEKAVHPTSRLTTIIQHIFGGHFQSQVICTNCDQVSNQYENMMDLTVEIHGDVASLEECLDQFTTKEWLHGENMYKCDGCNDYVKAWKRLTISQAPNILTIALKRFQGGRFGKLNKRVSFPETLDLSPYMSEGGDGLDVYKLYAVVVHVDMLNASFFGHYISYTKDFKGNWYRVDDSKVTRVGLDEVLSQGAYMLLYTRVCVRPSSLTIVEPSTKEELKALEVGVEPCLSEQIGSFSSTESINLSSSSVSLASESSLRSKISVCENYSSFEPNGEVASGQLAKIEVAGLDSTLLVSQEVSNCENGPSSPIVSKSEALQDPEEDMDWSNYQSSSPDLERHNSWFKNLTGASGSQARREDMTIQDPTDEHCFDVVGNVSEGRMLELHADEVKCGSSIDGENSTVSSAVLGSGIEVEEENRGINADVIDQGLI